MPKKNPKPMSDQEIERHLAAIVCSSEDEATDEEAICFASEHYNNDFDRRLDDVQHLSTDELHSLLVGESDFSLVQEESFLDHTNNDVQNQNLGRGMNAASTHDVTMTETLAGVLPNSLECSIARDETASTSHAVVAANQASTSPLLVVSEPIEQDNAEVNNTFSRHKFSQLQNRSRDWSSVVGSTWPTFEKEMQVKKRYTNRSQPLDYFIDYFPEELIENIVQNTNIYANHTHSKAWTDVTQEEMKAYFGLIILMSINPLADMQTYWSTDVFFRNPVICSVMPLKRFKKITENIHISNISTEAPRNSPSYDKLGKVRPAIEVLNKTFKENVEVSAFNSVDESMIKFKGRSHMKQYMPKKPIKRGYKCWARADSRTGYLYEFQFYTGRVDNGTEENLGARVVMDLCETLPIHTLVAFDNFFTSLPLLEILFEKEIYGVGTIRANRKGLPDLVTGKNLSREERKETCLKPGEFMYQYDGTLSVVKWKDTKDVLVATTAFDPRAIESIQRKQKDGHKKQMYCPLSIKKYTEFMGGVDHFDHYRASYPLGRKSRKNWHRLFWFMLEAAIINSYIVYMRSHSERRNTHKEFRLRLGRGLINNFTSRKKLAAVFKSKKGGVEAVPDEVRKVDVGSHMPELAKFRRCRLCSTRDKEQRSKYICKICKVPLCAAPCFYLFHQ